ncbi:MAG TPA: NAD(P)-dependent oxidoreductase, partial [Proteiniclasticum sp.]|nr:NAD(P)-dependent oxidoreductase [Proteiniclasticum sp.]
IVNEEDLYRILTEKKIKGAALDVTEIEPIRVDHPLLALENVIITPHIGMYSKEAINAVSLTCAENVAHYFRGEKMNFEVV